MMSRWMAVVIPGAMLFTLTACQPKAPPAWSGYVEGEYVYVAAPLGGALTRLAVQRGGEVGRGNLLFELEDESERAAREQAAAQASSTGAQAQDLRTGKRAQEIAVIDAQLRQAEAQAAQAAAELARQEQMIKQGFASGSRLDDARAAARSTTARVAELHASLRVANLPAREQELAAAAASTDAARYALDQARWRESQKQQRAPFDAKVADTFFREGEWVAAGQPVVSLLPPGATRVRFFVPEAELGSLAVGATVSVRCDGCAAPVSARINFLSTQAEYTPPVIYSNSQRMRLVYMVEARPLGGAESHLHPGQPVDVERANGAQ
jgi:HlyD family secretion protein